MYRLGAAALVAVLLFAGGYMKGKADGRVAVLKDTVEAYQKRGDVDAKVRNMDAADLCRELGGVFAECRELRGMGSDTGQAVDGGLSGRQ